jgi:hypothetical protein
MTAKSIKLGATALAIILGLSGCGTLQPFNSNPSNSDALNYARAGKVKSVKDFDLTQADVNSMLADWGSVTSKDFRPKQQTHNNLLIAWVPENIVSGEQNTMHFFSNTVAGAIEDALFDLSVPYLLDNRSLYQKFKKDIGYDYYFNSAGIEDHSINCPTWDEANGNIDDVCMITSTIVSPKKGVSVAPDFLHDSVLAYTFDASGDLEYSELLLQFPSDAVFDRLEILKAISHNLPAWAFIYAPGERVATGEFTAPLVFNQGIAHPFSRP